ncbi:HEAT repeat domain-containing protein [Streptomyces lunaelactis]|uniref:HEAT repeat domain-containing protein n=1 Tax=Streptomyces lunaelactis TaxID=1535768 RepID=UPI00158468F7|nr:HEAT repeat domain-containing protein [Streptomyces lunaelactis]NUK56180.1 HEAT repeat domain-containing protein [Streptomyces lunaelactis]NUL21530.1 HEAT repeat domain-containing protein [Streptomyces lunaelactis]
MGLPGYGSHKESRDTRLVSAVRARNADMVRALLEEGADPDAAGEDGLPVLCAAVTAYDEVVAEVLVEGGADQDQLLPDGMTPLLRAVDLGSPAMVTAVLGIEPQLRLPQAARERLLALARKWYEMGATEELRRRTGASGPAETFLVQDDEYNHVDQVSLGGLTVRAGHGAILTLLEWAFRILAPVDELMARAVRYPDEDHVDWSASCFVLSQRRSKETWSAVVAFRHHPAPAHRRFVTCFLRTRAISESAGLHSYTNEESQLLAAWAVQETDSEVLAKVLDVYNGDEHPGQEAVGLRHAEHPDPRVRREVPYCFHTYGTSPTPAATASLLTLARDPDSAVRSAVCTVLGTARDLSPEITQALLVLIRDLDTAVRASAAAALSAPRDRTPAVTDAFAALLDEDDQQLRLEGAYGLARRDDPRTEEAYERVGPLGPGFEHDHRPGGLWHWRRRNRPDQP